MSMDIFLTKKELASVAGYTYRRLHDIDMGLPEDRKLFVQGEGGKYDLATFVQRWVAYNVDRQSYGEDMSLEEAKATHEQVKIEKTRLEVAKMRGELIDVNEVRRLWANVANTVVQNLIRIPGKIGQQVFMVEKLDAVIGIIEKEIRDCLTGISETPIPRQADGAETEEENSEEGE